MGKLSTPILSSIDFFQKIVQEYLANKDTNYAYMITGEWGIGKTYMLKNKIIPCIKETKLSEESNLKYRPIYVSLSGISNLDRLKELMFSRINIQTQTTRTLIDEEIELLKNVVSEQDLNPLISIPTNIVFCFDDLERMSPLFLEEALGFINSYIEHNHTKVLFLCDEERLQKELRDRYRLIKEKYIRFTVDYRPNFEELLNENEDLSLDEKNLVILIFQKGLCNNIRTLEYVLSSNKNIFDSFHIIKEELKIDSKHVSLLRRLLIFYTAFFAIELKRGILSYESIKRIQIPTRLLSLTEQGFEIDFSYSQDEEKEIRQKNETEKVELVKINKRYFEGNFEPFEPFDCIAEYLRAGYLNIELLQNEIERIITSLEKREGTEEEKILKKIQNIFELPDDKYLDDIDQILNTVDKGEFSLGTYLQIYSQLLVLESYGVNGVVVDESVTKRFKESMTKSLKEQNIIYDSILMERYSSLWSYKESSNQSKKYHALLEFANNLNEDIIERGTFSIPIAEIIVFIEGNNYNELHSTLVEKKWDYTLNEENANQLFKILIEKNADQVNNFRTCLKERYTLRDGQTPASSEYPFIKKMIELTEKYEEQVKDNKTISYIPFLLMKNNLQECVRYFSLDKE